MTTLPHRSAVAICCVLAPALAVCAVPARADPAPPPGDIASHDSGWSPDYATFPYNLWRSRVTPEQVTALLESCRWFTAEYDSVIDQVLRFQQVLGDQHDDWRSAEVLPAADAVTANIRRAATFLEPRAKTLYVVNYPDQSRYSPLFQGDSVYHLWYQLVQIADKIDRRLPSGQINANSATALVYGDAMRGSGVCDGA